MGLFIVSGAIQVHRPDLGRDICLLLVCNAIFRKELIVGPYAVPRLHRDPNVSGVRRVLSDFSQRDEKPEESRRVIRLKALSCSV